MRPPEDFWSI